MKSEIDLKDLNTLDKLLEGIQIINPEWKYIYVNDSLVHQSHSTREQLLGRTMMEVYPGIEKSELFKSLKDCMENQVPRYLENEFEFPDKSKGWFELSIQPVPEGIFILSVDITSRKRSEEKLLTSERKYRSLIEQAFDGLLVTNATGECEEANIAACEMTGYSSEELTGMNPGHLFRDHDPGTGLIFREDLRIRTLYRKDGSVMTVEYHTKNLSDDYALHTFRDVTEKITSERTVKESEEKFRNLTETAFDAIILIDESGNVTFWNRGAELTFGYSKEEIIGKSLTLIMPEKYRTQHQTGMERYIKTGEKKVIGKVIGLEGLRKNGEVFPMDISITAWESAGKKIFSGIIRDATEQRKAEQAILKLNNELEQRVADRTMQLNNYIAQLEESEEKFEKAFHSSAAAISITRLSDTKFYEVNHCFEIMTGFSREELLGHSSTDLGIVVNMEDRAAILKKVQEEGSAGDIEIQVQSKTGSLTYAMGSIEVFYLNGERYALNILYDITARKNAEKSLKEAYEESSALAEELTASNEELHSTNDQLIFTNDKLEEATKTIEEQSKKLLQQKDEQLNRVLESMDVAIWSFDFTEGGRKYLSRSAEKIYGKPVEDLLNSAMFWMDRAHPEDTAVVDTSFERLSISGADECSYRVLTPGNKTKWIRQHLQLLRDDRGQLLRLEGIAADITRLKEAEDSVQTYRKNLEIIFNSTTEGFLLLDTDTRIVLFNKTFEKFYFSVTGTQLETGKSLGELAVPERKKIAEIFFAKALKGEMTRMETAYSTADGQFTLEVRYEPVYTGLIVTHVSVVTTDITQRKQLEEERRRIDLLQSEKELVEMRGRFISMASHELRTPLTSIMMAVGMIKSHPEKFHSEQLAEKLNSVIENAEFMVQLLDDVLVVGRSDEGRAEASLIEIEIDAFCKSLISTVLQNSGNTHNIRWNFNCQRPNIITDGKLLRNIVSNLLTNAIKFSPALSPIDFEGNCQEDTLILRIKDQGIGIDPDDLPRLFEPFFRARNSKHIHGTGLGLTIIKRAVDLLKGKLEVSSELGKGTEFTIKLPLTPP